MTHKKDTRIDFLQIFSKIIGEAAMGISVAVAVVAFFLSTSLTIAQVELTLQNANFLTIIAISFVLGFYHEDTRRLLGSFHKSFSGGNKADDNTSEEAR